jgi:diguanylate cyclase (GGDEF)-like protein/PAS domain S-box-containing protein
LTDAHVNILLVDDRPENLIALEAIVEKEEYRLIKASSGEEALKCLLRHDFALILLDVQMPGIDGFSTAKIIKARERTRNIPIIFITANSLDTEHVFNGYSVGAVDYILKPFDPFVLKAKVERYVEMYRLNQQLVRHAEELAEKTRELENANVRLVRTTADLHASEALANVISDTSLDSMIVVDQDGIVLKVNPAVRRMFGYDGSALLGDNIAKLFPRGASGSAVAEMVRGVQYSDRLRTGEQPAEIIAQRSDGSVFAAEIQLGKRYVNDRCFIACTIRDVEKKKRAQETIEHMAYHDGLTNLANRRRFNDILAERLKKAKETNQPLTMMFLDMDRFKHINDSLGHLIGDRVLKGIADRLLQLKREHDFVSRLGGDEFNIVLPNTNREDALDLAEDILEGFRKPFSIDNYELFVTLSIGISVFPYDGEDAISLMKSADAALYRAKEHGNSKIQIFHSGMNIRTYRAFVMQNDLRRAIDRKEMEIVYLPRIDIGTGAVTCAEAVMRWNHPDWGVIPSSEFMPLAEESSQSGEFGEWMFHAVCRQCRLWQDASVPLSRISVAFPSQQWIQKNMLDKVRKTIAEFGIEPGRIELEVKESDIMQNESMVMKTLSKLRELGVSVSIVGFGTGYSSLNLLRHFPVHALKIDKSFIQDISNRSALATALITAMVSLAHGLEMKVIAEGVETGEQLAILRKFECDEIQGYLFSPPILPEEFEEFLTRSLPESIVQRDDEPGVLPLRVVAPIELPMSQNQEVLRLALQRTREMYSISAREMEVFELIVDGASNKEISDRLFISEHTVKNHITHILQKLNVNDRLQAMAKVYQTCIEEGRSLRRSG